jgi:Zn-dependent protease with chaperone function/Flp pilus assembly protein TadD
MLLLIALVLAQVAPSNPEPFPYTAEQDKIGNEAYALLQAGKVAEAEAGLRKLVQLAPDNPRAYRLLGFALRQQDRPQEAIKAFDQAEALHVDAPRMLSLLGARAEAKSRLNLVADARKDLERAFELAPNDAQTMLISATINLRQGDILEATRDLERSIRAEPKNPAAHLLLARILAYQDKNDESRAEIALARAQGASEEQAAEADKGNRTADRMSLIWKVPLVLAAILGLAVLCLFAAGGALSKFEMSSLRELQPGSLRGESTAGERVVHGLYLGVLWFGTVFFYLSIPAMIILSLAVGGAMLYVVFTAHEGVPIKLVILALAVAVGSTWAVIRSLFLRTSTSGDIFPVTEESEPQLFAALREVSEVAGTRMVDKVYLELGASASVRESGGALQVLMGRGERVLHLGFWTLFGLSKSELKAILAHEYGHFSHGETRLTPVIGRIQGSMFQMLIRMAKLGYWVWINPVYWYLRAYFPSFLAATAGHSRRKELLADRAAALAYGGDTFGNALRKVVESDLVFDRYAGPVAGLLRRSGRPCSELYRAVAAARAVEPASLQSARAQKVLTREAGKYDSHPPAADRIARVAGVSGRHEEDSAPAVSLLVDADGTGHALAERIRVNVEVSMAEQKIRPGPAVAMEPEAQLWFAEGLALHAASQELAEAKDPEANGLLMKATDRLRAALGEGDPLLQSLLGKEEQQPLPAATSLAG